MQLENNFYIIIMLDKKYKSGIVSVRMKLRNAI